MTPTARRLIIVEDRQAGGMRSRLAGLAPGARSRRQLVEARREIDRLRRRVHQLQLRDDLGYLFVMTYGRSGSTLLQGILNSIPGYLIRGENRQALIHVYRFHHTAVKQRALHRRGQRQRGEEVGGLQPTKSWYGMDNFGVRASLRDTRRLALDTLLRPEPDTRVTGFKEIRWTSDDVDEYVAWLRKVFPGARFVVNTRDLHAVAQSKWWAETPDAYDHLQEREERLLRLAGELGDAAFRVHYDDYVDNPQALKPLLDWLGEDFHEARIRAVMDVPHSY
jgi:hypothetical protein